MGNVLMEDEGLGVRAVESLQRQYRIPPGIELLDGGTTGMGLLDDIGGREYLLVLDAVRTGDPPGTLVRMSDEEVPVYFGMRITPHQLGLSDVLATLELTGEGPGRVTVLGLVPESLELSIQLSARTGRRMQRLVQAAVGELQSLGYALERIG